MRTHALSGVEMESYVPDVVVYAVVVVVTVGAAGAAVPGTASQSAKPIAQQTAATGTTTPTPEPEPTSNESVAPGQQFAGVVGVQGAEVEGEVERRALNRRASQARTNETKAELVASELNRARERLTALHERQTDLREAQQAGEMSNGEFRARMAITSAEIRSVSARLDSSEQLSRDLPNRTLEANGVDRSEFDRLKDDADEMQGGEVAEIARRIGGGPPDRAGGPDRDPGDRQGPPRGDADGENGPSNASDPGRPDDAGENNGKDEDKDENGENGTRSDGYSGRENGADGNNNGGSDRSSGSGGSDGAGSSPDTPRNR
jgi:hypothetical protein